MPYGLIWKLSSPLDASVSNFSAKMTPLDVTVSNFSANPELLSIFRSCLGQLAENRCVFTNDVNAMLYALGSIV